VKFKDYDRLQSFDLSSVAETEFILIKNNLDLTCAAFPVLLTASGSNKVAYNDFLARFSSPNFNLTTVGGPRFRNCPLIYESNVDVRLVGVDLTIQTE